MLFAARVVLGAWNAKARRVILRPNTNGPWVASSASARLDLSKQAGAPDGGDDGRC